MASTSGTPRVYTGTWMNHGTGSWVLTLDASSGTFVFTLAVFYVSVVANMSWLILKCVVHRFGTAGYSRRSLRGKEQIVIRNSGSALQAILQLCAIRLDASKHPKGASGLPYRHNLPSWETVLFVLFILFWAASTNLASFIATSTDNSVLLVPNTCGSQTNGFDLFETSQVVLKRFSEVERYYETCYKNDGGGKRLCETLPVAKLPYSMQNSGCPFKDDLCVSANSTPVQIQSGFNSNSHFGINARLEDTVDFRRVATCSPIRERSVPIEASSPTDVEDECKNAEPPQIMGFDYGPSETTDSFSQGQEQTIKSNLTLNITISTKAAVNAQSGHGVSLYFVGYEPDFRSPYHWMPDPSLFDTEMDQMTSLYFLFKEGTVFAAPNYDPWLLANESTSGTPSSGQKPAFFTSPRPVSCLGCVEFLQLCLPGENADCSDPLGYEAMYSIFHKNNVTILEDKELHLPQFSKIQQDTIRQVTAEREGWSILAASSISGILGKGELSVDSLAATDIPVDQWRHEVERWFASSLAYTQMQTLEWVVGLSESEFPGIRRADDANDPSSWTQACKQQRGRDVSGKVINLSMSGLVIIFSLGTAIILAGLWVEIFYTLSSEKAEVSTSKRAQWTRDSLLELIKPENGEAEGDEMPEHRDSRKGAAVQAEHKEA